MAPTKFGWNERVKLTILIEQRMEDHRRWQHATEHALIEEIIDEVQSLPKRQPRNGMLLDFEASTGFSRRNLRRAIAQ